jgi:RHS repeat-associated protein
VHGLQTPGVNPRVKVHGARAVRVTVAGEELSTAEGWAGAELGHAITASELQVALEPLGPDAEIRELEAWGAGREMASRDLAALARASASPRTPALENTWVLRAATPDAVLQPPGAGEGSPCVRTTFPRADPRQARRAYLVFEADVPRAHVLRHSFGGAAPVSGMWLGATPELRTLVREIDPESLHAGDDLLVCLPEDAGGPVRLSALRLLLLLDDGANSFDRETVLRLPAAIDGNRDSAQDVPAGAVELGLDRAIDAEGGELRLDEAAGTLEGVSVLDGTAWRDVPDARSTERETALPISGRVSALRLAFTESASGMPAARVEELSISGSGVGPRVGAHRIVLTSPIVTIRDGTEIGERFGPRAFVAGWAESPSGRGVVEVDGARVDTDGAFSVPLERPAAVADGWTVTLRARFPDGVEVTRAIRLDDDREAELLGADPAEATADDLRFGRENETGRGAADPAAGGTVKLGTDVSLEVPPGAVEVGTELGITRKGREMIPPLDAGMINVTSPAHGGYRFTPRGQRFAAPVKIRLPYDPGLLPDGVAPEEIQTYYFDEAQGRWLALPRKHVLRATRQIVSETTHFTFMINAVLVLPDHPGPVSFNPNSIKDLKAADPSAGIDFIEPPQGNNQGTARLSFPIRLPKARGAYQPSLAIAYDSAGGNGWLGVGWDLAASRVQIDTRYGVPDYSGEERYVLDGEVIVPVARASEIDGSAVPAVPPAPATCLDGSGAREYRARVERDFRRILRCGGSDPSRFWFEVTDKGGTLYVYGRRENARLASYVPRVTPVPVFPPVYDVAEWHLERVVDANGNFTEFTYQHDSRGPQDTEHGEPFRQLYLRAIRYTGWVQPPTGGGRDASALDGGTPGPYLVELRHHAKPRPDVITSARTGFKTMLRRRLGEITVRLLAGTPSGLVRKYVLAYEHGDLGKSRLHRVDVLGADERTFYSHAFTYEDRAPDRDGVTLFGTPIPWLTASPGDAGLSGSREWAFGFHGFVGLGWSPVKETGTVGVGFGYGQRRSTVERAFMDLNGDGLPDRVHDGSDFLSGDTRPDRILFNHGAGEALSADVPKWDPAWSAGGASLDLANRRLGKETGHSFDASLQAFYGSVGLNFGASYSLSKSEDFTLDANGDGLVDVVNGGKVFFNQPRASTCPAGATPRECCVASGFCFLDSLPMQALESLGDSSERVESGGALARANADMQEALTPEDAVIEWTAPYDGAVDVMGSLAFTDPTTAGERRDGVRLTVYHFDPEAPPDVPPARLGTYLKTPGDATGTPVRLGGVRVRRGENLYFVLSTLTDFPMNAADGAISPLERVRFAPVVTYLGTPGAERDLPDPTGAMLYRFDAAADFALAGNPQGSVTVPRDGKVALTLAIDKRATSDQTRVCVQYVPPPPAGEAPPTPVPCRGRGAAPSPGAQTWKDGAFSLEYDPADLSSAANAIVTPAVEVKAGGTFFFRVDTHLAVDPRAIRVRASGAYACVQNGGVCVAPDPREAARLSFTSVPFMTLHESLARGGKKWEPSGAPLRPFRPSKPGTLSWSSFMLSVDGDVAPVVFSIRTLDRQIFKAVGPHFDLLPDTTDPVALSGSTHLAAGEPVFLEAHSESAAGAAWASLWAVGCRFTYDDRTGGEDCNGFAQVTTDRNEDGWEDGNQPLLSGGFHGWRYGAWHGTEGESFKGWVFRGPSKQDAGDWSGTEEERAKRNKDQLKNPNDPQRTRLRLVGFAVPSVTGTNLHPTDDAPVGFEKVGSAFVTQDGNAYFMAGVVHAGKKGKSASELAKDPEGATAEPLEFRVGKLGRTSAAVTVSAGASIGAFGGSLSAGVSQQKVDVVDMNGDGILDVVAAGGIPDITDLDFNALAGLVDGAIDTDVRVTSPVSLATGRKVTMRGVPQLSYDLSGQVNLGASPAMLELKSDGEVRGAVSRFPGFGGGAGFSVATVVQQLADVNGDGLPDVVRRSASACAGGFAVRLNMGTSFAAADDCLPAAAFAADGVLGGVAPGGDEGDGDTARAAGIGRGIQEMGSVRRSTTVTLQGTGSASLMLSGGILPAESYGLSVSAETSISATNDALVDVTGDGLPDYVHKDNQGNDFVVWVNRGYGFASPLTWHSAAGWRNPGKCPRGASSCAAHAPTLELGIPAKADKLVKAFVPVIGDGVDAIEATGSHSTIPSVAVSFNFAWPIWGIIPAPPYLHIGAGTHVAPEKVSGFELGLQDIDGDGLADHVLKSTANDVVWARLNQLGRANLLKHVERPLGGSIDLAYEQRVGNTVDMQESRWVMTTVTVRDGRAPVPGAVGHDLATSYAYQGGKRDRYEREFLGFAKVIRKNPDDSTVEQEFTTTLLKKGLLVAERMRDREGHLWGETVNTWSDPVEKTFPAAGCEGTKPVLLDVDSWCGSFFTGLDAVERRFFEGEARARIVTRQEFEYDDKGDVRFFRDFGDVADAADDLNAEIVYARTGSAWEKLYSVSRPESVVVRDRSSNPLRVRSAQYDDFGNLRQLTAWTGGAKDAVSDLHWNANGTLDSFEGPENAAGQRYKTTYGYDGVSGTYVTATTDSHGYGSTAEYDLRFGEATSTTDLNGNVSLRQFDALGRLERLAGANDSLDVPTVAIRYMIDAHAPYALTRNRLPRKQGDVRGTVDTVVVMDGLGRVIQTKKTAELATSETTTGVGWSISGHETYDRMGRLELQGQPFASFSSRAEYVAGTPKNPTRFAYDVLGRNIQTVEANGAVTRVAYGFGTPSGTNALRFLTTTWDPEGNVRTGYKDASDRVTEVEERIDGRTPITHYEYDPVGDLTRIIDAAGNVTRIEYDRLGRRTKLVNPDTGEVRFEIDPAGNLVKRFDPNLDDAQGFIEYVYDYDQLTDVKYPKSRDVHYTYGTTAAHRKLNGLGRIVEVTDDAGRELRTYGALGELKSSTRVLRPILPGDRERTFTTSFTFDSFGRMMTITYPDRETVEYEYDAGGLLRKATGRRTSGLTVEEEPYLAGMAYDEFGQRAWMKLGNGVGTTYTYEPLTRRLHTLTTVTPLNRTLQAITYGYDRVGNVRTMVNQLGEAVGDRSGETRFEYRYDPLYRLTWAHGEAKSRPHTIDRFTATYAYSDVHNMTSNVQVHEIVHGDASGVGVERPPKTNHDFAYTYGSSAPHQATKIGDNLYVYDGNGNTIAECRDHGDPTCATGADHLRTFSWTEENRLDHVIDGGGRNVTRFVYDAAGERVVKLGRGGESITIGQFWSLKGRRAATKHVFAGPTRLASKLLPPPGWDDVPRSGSTVTVSTVGDGAPNETGCDPSNYVPQKCPELPGGEPTVNHYYDDTKVRPETYFYHPDHLGSTSWVTDQNARVHEHVEYFPYGEVWRDPRSDSDGAPVKGQRFLFTGKELDEETGLAYHGARYYDPVRARWSSADPALPAFLAGSAMAGAYEPLNLSVYAYCYGNPITRVDPTGLWPDWWDKAKSKYDKASPAEKAFVKDHPMAAWVIGKYEKGGTNISTVASDFAMMGKSSDPKDSSILSPEKRNGPKASTGGQNAMRHVLLQALTTVRFDAEIAEASANAHEENTKVDMTRTVFRTYDEADMAVDYHNNIIGRAIGAENQGKSRVDVAKAVLEKFHSEGLWVGYKTAKGWEIRQVKVSEARYEAMKAALENKDDNARWKSQ